jgi:acetylglutamate kinase
VLIAPPLMLTDVPGVLDKEKRLIPDLTVAQVRQGIEGGTGTIIRR